MGEIEVNEYVRTDLGIIYEYTEDEKNDLQMRDFRLCNDGNIVNHSKQLIDLIEVGDFVNGYKVISVDYDVMNDTTECIELDLNNNYQYNFISIRQIETILTHEQFEQNSYKVGGEE